MEEYPNFALQISEKKFRNFFSVAQKSSKEMEFLDINFSKDFCSMLFTVPSTGGF